MKGGEWGVGPFCGLQGEDEFQECTTPNAEGSERVVCMRNLLPRRLFGETIYIEQPDSAAESRV